MRIRLEGIAVSDQDHALRFYTEKLGFVKKLDQEIAPGARLLMLVSPEDPDGAQLMLEPSGEHPPTKAYKEALMKEGLPFTAFQVDDLDAEHERLTGLGVEFRMPPTDGPGSKMATFDDTCGHLIMIYQETGEA
ncbi:MAG: VOC family protein [Planctomycetota bacterium]